MPRSFCAIASACSSPRRGDRLSRLLVRLGGLLVAGFCLLSLWFALAQAGDLRLIGAAGCALLGLTLRTAARRRSAAPGLRPAAEGEQPVSAPPEAPS